MLFCSITMVITAESECTRFCHCNVFVFWSSSRKGEICRWVSCFVKAFFSSTCLSYFLLRAFGKLVCSEWTNLLEVKFDENHSDLNFFFLQDMDSPLSKVPTPNRRSLVLSCHAGRFSWREPCDPTRALLLNSWGARPRTLKNTKATNTFQSPVRSWHRNQKIDIFN